MFWLGIKSVLPIIRLESLDGTISVLLTNLFGSNEFKFKQIQDLYYARWKVEKYYRNEKVTFEIEKFHSKTEKQDQAGILLGNDHECNSKMLHGHFKVSSFTQKAGSTV
jgi:hypothetical protein